MKKCTSIFIALIVTTFSYAQAGKFEAAINSVTAETSTWLDPLIKFLYIMVSIIGVYGIFKIFGKVQTGDQDTGKAIAQWGGGIVFILAGIFILKALQ